MFSGRIFFSSRRLVFGGDGLRRAEPRRGGGGRGGPGGRVEFSRPCPSPRAAARRAGSALRIWRAWRALSTTSRAAPRRAVAGRLRGPPGGADDERCGAAGAGGALGYGCESSREGSRAAAPSRSTSLTSRRRSPRMRSRCARVFVGGLHLVRTSSRRHSPAPRPTSSATAHTPSRTRSTRSGPRSTKSAPPRPPATSDTPATAPEDGSLRASSTPTTS